MRRVTVALLSSALLAAAAVSGPAATAAGPPGNGPWPTGDIPAFQVVGHDPLFNRGMNAALAIYGNYVYVGNRTDGSAGHPHPGVLIIDASDPAQLRTVGEIGPPLEGVPYETSRELRVLPEQKLLMVLNFQCSSLIHACAEPPDDVTVEPTINFFDLTDPVHPRHVSTYRPRFEPHEFFLWVDPQRPGRVLIWYSTPTRSTDPAEPNMVITDISQARQGVFHDLVQFNPNRLFPEQALRNDDVFLHSMGVSYDGRRTYLAYLGGGFLVADSSEVAAGLPNPRVRLITKPQDRVHWGDPGAHSAVKVPGRPLALITDEVYGVFNDLLPDHGCPWGWVRIVDISRPAHPDVISQYKVKQNRQSFCDTVDFQTQNFSSYSSHNPTVVGSDLALITWHSAGLQAVDISNPAHPRSAGEFVPKPLAHVATEDPALNGGRNDVTMWSYPIIKDGLIYVTDIRNGLYVLRYIDPQGNRPLRGIDFLEGNSNLGDAVRFGS